MRNLPILFAALSLLSLPMQVSGAEASHPYTAYGPMLVSDADLTSPRPAKEINSLTFRGCEKRASELTPAEHYILRGLQPTDTSGHPEAWKSKIFLFVMAYRTQHGELPTVISNDALRTIGMDIPDIERFNSLAAWYKSPITGEFPRLDNPEFTPGGVYFRELTAEELIHLGLWDPPLAGKRSGQDGVFPDIELVNPVLYFRFYGETGLLEESYSYIFLPKKSS